MNEREEKGLRGANEHPFFFSCKNILKFATFIYLIPLFCCKMEKIHFFRHQVKGDTLW